MDMWLVFLGFHLFGFVGYNLMLRKSVTDNIDRFTLATVMQTGITIPLIFTLFFHVPSFDSYDLGILALVIGTLILTIALHVTNTVSLKYLEASVYSVLYNLRIVFTTILGIIFLGEDTDWLRICGGILILLAIFIVKQKGSKSIISKGFEWGLAAALTISFLNLFEKELITDIGYLNYAVPLMAVATLIMWGYLYYRDRAIDYKIMLKPRMIQLMALRDISAFGFVAAFAYGGLLSVSNYISSMGVIFMVALGVLLLDERDYLRRKIIATGVAVCGLTLVLIASLI